MFHLMMYSKATGGSVTDFDLTAATDPDFSQRNGHYIFTEPYYLLGAYAFAPHLTRTNIQSSTLNAITRLNVWPSNESSITVSPPQIDSWLNYPLSLPVNEEIQVLVTDGTSEVASVLLWVADNTWNQNIPRGIAPLPLFEMRVTASLVSVANTWAGLGAVTFEQQLRGGTYAIVGSIYQSTNVVAVREVFPRMKIVNGRKQRPGSFCQNAIGDLMPYNLPMGPMSWGEHGRFSTFEPPQLECWSPASATNTIEGRWWLVRLGEGMDVTY